VLGGLLVLWQELPRVDPVLCLLMASFIIFSSWGLLKDFLNYELDAVPRNIDVQSIRQYLANLDQVDRLHDLHVWPLNTSEVALTVNLVVHQQSLDNALFHQFSSMITLRLSMHPLSLNPCSKNQTVYWPRKPATDQRIYSSLQQILGGLHDD
jgi:Co/Zn/Cd efflux system component